MTFSNLTFHTASTQNYHYVHLSKKIFKDKNLVNYYKWAKFG
jgi:hypothetical protein